MQYIGGITYRPATCWYILSCASPPATRSCNRRSVAISSGLNNFTKNCGFKCLYILAKCSFVCLLTLLMGSNRTRRTAASSSLPFSPLMSALGPCFAFCSGETARRSDFTREMEQMSMPTLNGVGNGRRGIGVSILMDRFCGRSLGWKAERK